MKLKKASDQEEVADLTPVAPAPGAAVIADRFKLDAVEGSGGPAGVGRTAATIALVCSLAAIGLLGVTAWLLYQNWELIRNV